MAAGPLWAWASDGFGDSSETRPRVLLFLFTCAHTSLTYSTSRSKNQFDAQDWEIVIKESPRRLCWDYAHLFGQKANDASEENDGEKQAVYEFLYGMTSLRIDPDAEDGPFHRLFVAETRRAPSLDGFDNDELEVLKDLLPEAQDPELKARFADILWLRRIGNYKVAGTAVKSYVKAAESLVGMYNNRPTLLRYERALGIAAGLGKNTSHFRNVALAIEKKIREYARQDTSRFVSTLSSFLYSYRLGDSQEQANLAKANAEYCESEEDFRSANIYWETAARWSARAGDQDAEQTSQVRAAEAWVNLAEEAPMRGVASYFYTRAFIAYRQIPNTDERREELHQLLLQAQQESTAEHGKISINIGDEKAQEQAQSAISGKALEKAIEALAFITQSPTQQELEDATKSSAQKAPFQALSGAKAVNAMGKVIGQKPSAFEDEEDAFAYELHRTANFLREWDVANLIEPARLQVFEEHLIRIRDLFYILRYNPFVPPHRIAAYAKGLYAGFRGDFMVAAHLLVPQLEESMRHLLRQKGVITSGLDDYRIQHERNLNTILTEEQYRSHIVEMVGEDLTFDLQGLLVDARGANLRNDVAHGLLDDGAYQNRQAIYLWWISLHLCCLWYLTTLPEDTG